MDLLYLIFLAVSFTFSKGDGGCKELDYLECIKNKALTGHVIKSFKILAPGLKDCQHKCFVEDKCVSYNLGPVNGMVRTCELNDVDHVSDPGHVTSKEDFEYCPIKNPCSSSPCSHDQWCEPDFYWNKHKCISGKWTQWMSLCQCPRSRKRVCINRLNSSLPSSTCGGPEVEVPKKCKSAMNITGCSEPLGMQDRSISDGQITASSETGVNYPYEARLNNPIHWATNPPAQTGEYLQIDLGSINGLRWSPYRAHFNIQNG